MTRQFAGRRRMRSVVPSMPTSQSAATTRHELPRNSIANSKPSSHVKMTRSTMRTEQMQREAVHEYLAEQRRHHAECHASNEGISLIDTEVN